MVEKKFILVNHVDDLPLYFSKILPFRKEPDGQFYCSRIPFIHKMLLRIPTEMEVVNLLNLHFPNML